MIRLITTFLILFSASLLNAKNLSYQGKSLEEWFIDLGPIYPGGSIESFDKHDKAMVALKNIGPDCISYLLENLKYESSSDNKSRATSGFWALKSRASSAIPELSKKLLRKEKPIVQAASALSGIGTPEVIPILTEGLKHEDLFVKSLSASALGSIGKVASPVIDNVISLLKRRHYFKALLNLHRPSISPRN